MLSNHHNPDILTCIANLSSDEVFTPPRVANQMLDSLPKEIWKDETVKFLDPVSKSGVFLREITKRLLIGLEGGIPDIENRLDHILKKQVFGIGVTELTSLISRRTLYCSKHANGKYSIVKFNNKDGNIKYIKAKHSWGGRGTCRYCGASKRIYERDKTLEAYAYSFIHRNNPEEIFNMKFDVIVGNPPYQMTDGGHGASATPIYNKFIEQAIKLEPRYLTMIVPSRWFAGGRGLDNFREKMLSDKRVREIHDFFDAGDCFPGVEIKGGVNYFLWERDYEGDCLVNTYIGKQLVSKRKRPLAIEGADVFVRHNEGISVLKKVKEHNESSFFNRVSSNDPFGFDKRQPNSMRRVRPKFSLKRFSGAVKLYYYGWQKKGVGYIQKNTITRGTELVRAIKVLITQNYGAGEGYPHQIINKPFIAANNSCCTETYLTIGPFTNREIAENVISYIKTKFFRFLVMLKKNTQGAYKEVYEFVPDQDFSRPWTDKKLYKKYGLSKKEISMIERMIKEIE